MIWRNLTEIFLVNVEKWNVPKSDAVTKQSTDSIIVFDQMKIDGGGSFKIYNDGSLNTQTLTYQRNYNDSYKLHNPHISPPALIVYCSFKWEAHKNNIDKVHDPQELCDPVKAPWSYI